MYLEPPMVQHLPSMCSKLGAGFNPQHLISLSGGVGECRGGGMSLENLSVTNKIKQVALSRSNLQLGGWGWDEI